MAEWYYIGHYGQLGPLTREQLDELIEGGVIEHSTYVWRTGMAQWLTADTVPDLASTFKASAPFASPPPPPVSQPFGPSLSTSMTPMPRTQGAPPQVSGFHQPAFQTMTSDRSRVLAGVLQLLIPGVGRIYLGYSAYGVMQLLLFPCGLGIGWLWSVIDGIVILAGGVKLDGYGRQLVE